MLPGDRLICAFVQPTQVGSEFVAWPLHITVVPWFRTDVSSSQLAQELAESLSAVRPFAVTLNGEAHFGFKGSKVVRLVVEPSPLSVIEQQSRAVLHRHKAWIVDETTKRQRAYTPHVTNQRHSATQSGEQFVCQELYIVEQQGNQKKVCGMIGLRHE